MPELKSWGVEYSEDFLHASDLICPNCNIFNPDFKIPVDLLVGFSTTGPGVCFPRVGIIIFECDICFQKFWYHLTMETLIHLRRKSDKWPKD